MNSWWYTDVNEQKQGPVDLDAVSRLLQIGAIGATTLLWQKGMAGWLPLEQIDELSALLDQTPPPLPGQPRGKSDSAHSTSLQLAGRWARFWARNFDVTWETIVVAFVLAFFLTSATPWFGQWISEPGADSLFGILCIPLAMVLDALIYKIFGNTPGKALCGLKVGTLRGEPLRLDDYLLRNLAVWGRGLALGIPVIGWGTMIYQSRRIAKGLPASYDESSGHRVRPVPAGWIRNFCFVVSWFVLLAGIASLNTIGTPAVRTSVKSAPAKVESEMPMQAASEPVPPSQRQPQVPQPYQWTNPDTNLYVDVASQWTYKKDLDQSGSAVHMFMDNANNSVVVFSHEVFPQASLKQYVEAFREANVNAMLFNGRQTFAQKQGKPVWYGSGVMADDKNLRINVEIRQVGTSFWRLVSVQSIPYDITEAQNRDLGELLWLTVEQSTI